MYCQRLFSKGRVKHKRNKKLTRGSAVESLADRPVDNNVLQFQGGNIIQQGGVIEGEAREVINRDRVIDLEGLGTQGEGSEGEEDGGEGVEVPKKIRINAWNSEGLFEKLSLNGVCEYINSFDIACLGETFTFSSFDFNVKFGDFIALHSLAKKFNIRGRPSGGLVVLIRKTL